MQVMWMPCSALTVMVRSLERWLCKKPIGRTTTLEKYFRQLQPFLIHGIAVIAGVVFHFAVVRLLGVKEAGVFFSSFAMYSVFLMLSLHLKTIIPLNGFMNIRTSTLGFCMQ